MPVQRGGVPHLVLCSIAVPVAGQRRHGGGRGGSAPPPPQTLHGDETLSSHACPLGIGWLHGALCCDLALVERQQVMIPQPATKTQFLLHLFLLLPYCHFWGVESDKTQMDLCLVRFVARRRPKTPNPFHQNSGGLLDQQVQRAALRDRVPGRGVRGVLTVVPGMPDWERALGVQATPNPYRGTSPTRKRLPPGPFSRAMPRALRWSQGGGGFL